MPLDIEIDKTSVNAIESELSNLYEAFYKAQSDSEKKVLADKIKASKTRLDEAKKYLNEEKTEIENFYEFVQSASRSGLISKKSELKEELKQVKDTLGKESNEYKKLEDQIKKINEETGSDLASIADKFAGSFSEISEMFRKFGDDDTAKLLDQLSGVAAGIGQIAAGDVLGGALSIVNSAITVEVVSDTSAFEAAIKEIEKAIDRLDYVISKSVGSWMGRTK
ncbi:hypothetical protein [Formosa haliotis]|uniref:hypothetical protein n=1 Tax=Formosa haliotis TaxID=1555194 RepID=UPI00082476D9|nr:hypothetical protein [Formosa haliotis]